MVRETLICLDRADAQSSKGFRKVLGKFNHIFLLLNSFSQMFLFFCIALKFKTNWAAL
ncbi:hypothetical protein Tb927.2.960 [Trypanosoma brucei brucei TREU927]|uniref:Uncharacterized protein n=1 Tax=Trypanosoma brucei brucei (strain 927/4 GUTat10.1) TaxID=185431 RepID=Q585G8_TRYB2|nr:hypothetical protein Tb927.2.960 [Trypanosoma brucei brucei TREU927]AAQ15568.1 hypothetical protein Tb927.2.960 [Trypanosoma brucei brucei TREU927]AAX79190.1 hypothetical protein Tb927.2.960 [Trypanosoma brucei]